ncbi:hypothetical protein DCE79_10175 [Lysinibacillus sp. 2017]|uniref:response regulator transcription factor n=1 Tax=unclassified Lysinibacillus TaxID=2636778 RepID=UPI000D52A7F2|nr:MULTISPECIES: LuxR C-terminal-related transcriptional regulator [unclassified Lysinibacillus]AWE07728.1 hypothetical protein DCE79_10175 [Lysinibacillus sp. 2017]TGN32298.1 helix-turn-helix transcriptional regulator [Lysinibacillus sp. S2017]
MSSLLPIKDYEKIIHFASQITKSIPKTRSIVLKELENIFDYKHTLFWLSDKDGNLKNPLNNNISDKMLSEYLDDIYIQDFLYPSLNIKRFEKRNALKLMDVVTKEQYEESEYFKRFMLKYGFYDEMVITLKHDEQIIGAIGVVSKENSNQFTWHDVLRFNYLSQIISSVLLHCNEETKFPLTSREMEIIELVKIGCTNSHIGEELYISINTVKKHLNNIFQKLSVTNRVELLNKLF